MFHYGEIDNLHERCSGRLPENQFYCLLQLVHQRRGKVPRPPHRTRSVSTPEFIFGLSLRQDMSIRQLGQLMWDIYQFDCFTQLLKKKRLSNTLNLYRVLCQRFVNRDGLKSWIKSSQNLLVEVTKCLLWFDDEELVHLFMNSILTAYPVNQPNFVIMKMAESMELAQQFIRNLPSAREAISNLLDQRFVAITQELDRAFEPDWIMPSAVFPDLSVVHNFLRSSAQQMTYANFSSTDEAKTHPSCLRLDLLTGTPSKSVSKAKDSKRSAKFSKSTVAKMAIPRKKPF